MAAAVLLGLVGPGALVRQARQTLSQWIEQLAGAVRSADLAADSQELQQDQELLADIGGEQELLDAEIARLESEQTMTELWIAELRHERDLLEQAIQQAGPTGQAPLYGRLYQVADLRQRDEELQSELTRLEAEASACLVSLQLLERDRSELQQAASRLRQPHADRESRLRPEQAQLESSRLLSRIERRLQAQADR